MWFGSVVFAAIISFACCGNDFNNEILKAHNKYRDIHGVPHLTINKKLNVYAQEWADHLAKINDLKHRDEQKYGENIYFTTGKLNAEVVVKAFYDEIKDYDFDKADFDIKTGHFTQVVWKNSKEIGIGVSESKNGRKYVVINYDPAGNVYQQFKENVPRPMK